MKKLTLIGAGPGDPELITLKGLKALQQADVILYDGLVSTELLHHAGRDIPRHHVGKRAGRASLTQDEINRLIVDMAHLYGHVVRLKGGDPFVFGRGYEEYDYAMEHGIDCEIVQGVSSCISVAASQGIPVTSRGVSESFWVITGTTRTGEISNDLKLAVGSTATVVVLMGLNKLREIGALYMLNGRGNTPVAVVQNGTRPDERQVTGFIHEIADKAEAAQLGSPAVIIIGDVVKLHRDFITRTCHEVNASRLENREVN